jgi:hypothetical protein
VTERVARRYPPPMRRLLAVFVLAALLAGRTTARAEDRDFKSEPEWKALLATEAKRLAPLLKTAVKEGYRRQAWYLADRILAAKPGDADATAALETWKDTELTEGPMPSADFVKKRDGELGEIGDEYAKYAEKLEAAQVAPERTHELQVRAHAYGAKYSALHAAMEQAGYVWLGTLLDHEIEPIKKASGPHFQDLAYPLEFDDAFLKVRVRWPEARIVSLGRWRLITDAKPLEAVAAVVALERARDHVVKALGGSPGDDPRPVDVVWIQETETYDKLLGRLLARPEDQKDAALRSSWYERRVAPDHDRLLVAGRDRHNAFAGKHASLLYGAAQPIARLHFAQKAGGSVQGRGAWLVDGLGGALEGLMPPRDAKEGAIDPARCWRLSAARVLQEQGVLLSWDKFLEVDAAKAKEWPRREMKLTFQGSAYDAREVDVAAAQATAFVLGVMTADKGKGARRLGDLLRETIKRDSLPDLDKTLGWKAGRWQQEAERMLAK